MAEKQSSLLQGIDVAPKAKDLGAEGSKRASKQKLVLAVLGLVVGVGLVVWNLLSSDPNSKPLAPNPATAPTQAELPQPSARPSSSASSVDQPTVDQPSRMGGSFKPR